MSLHHTTPSVECISAPLILTNRQRSGLLVAPDRTAHILIECTKDDKLMIYELTSTTCRKSDLTVSAIGAHYLGLSNLSLHDLLSYLVTPIMEVERIFNCLRFKYLRAIYQSKFENPQQCISHRYNRAFQTLAGLTVYQGGRKPRIVNDAFWQEAGFTLEAKEQNWHQEHTDMGNILSLLKRISTKPLTRLYAELIAIKPGFHELYLHGNYFDEQTIPSGTSPRDQVFRMLRNKEDISSLTLGRLPAEINRNSYISYAPCSITEGPFVFRKHSLVSYYSEIQQISSKAELSTLSDKFHILDYYTHDLSTRDKLGAFLDKAAPYCGFMT